MEPLTADKIEKYRRKLADLQTTLTREYWKDREATLQERKENAEDTVDLAVRSYTRDFLLSLGEEERKRLFMIEDALGRIERGEYGTCSHCGSRIPERRLEAVPWARLCIVCQGLQEDGLLPRWTFTPGRAARKPAGPRG